MKRSTHRVLLAVLAASMLVALASFFVFEEPEEQRGTAVWISTHPADWLGAAELTDRALDQRSPNRVELWRASYALASHLAPYHPNANAALVRSGLFHWYELGERERREVVAAAEPLLRDTEVFRALHRPLWVLTGDFALLRRANPGTIEAWGGLAELAATNGMFAEYREMREQLQRVQLAEFERRRDAMSPHDVVHATPHVLDSGDEPLVRAILAELAQRPLDAATPPPARLVEFALRRNLTPLDGIESFTRSNGALPARLALRVGNIERADELELAHAAANEEWLPYRRERAALETKRGNSAAAERQLAAAKAIHAPQWRRTCAPNELCEVAWTEVTGDANIELTVLQSDRVPPLVEVYVDDRHVGDREVRGRELLRLDLDDDVHRIELRVANPRTRNGTQRRLRLS